MPRGLPAPPPAPRLASSHPGPLSKADWLLRGASASAPTSAGILRSSLSPAQPPPSGLSSHVACQGGGGLPWTPRVPPRCAFVSLEPLVTARTLRTSHIVFLVFLPQPPHKLFWKVTGWEQFVPSTWSAAWSPRGARWMFGKRMKSRRSRVASRWRICQQNFRTRSSL